jgi:8-oxo-dGTP pyrophosphatase MutT (NUDIX family)
VLLIHRERYNDWTFPKGKREPGEHVLATAVREVQEETGHRVVLGRPLGQIRYASSGYPKVVDYWAATIAGGPGSCGGGFTPNDEVDRIGWVPLAAAPAGPQGRGRRGPAGPAAGGLRPVRGGQLRRRAVRGLGPAVRRADRDGHRG